MEADENALGETAADAGGAGLGAGQGYRLEPGNDLYDAQETHCQGPVTMDSSGKFQKYSAAITYADVEPEETESFLSKVYGGSVGMMVSNLVDRGALSERDIQELRAILDAAEPRED